MDKSYSASSINGREVKRPTLLPHSFTRWSKEYLIEAVRNFGDAGEALRLGKHPDWRDANYTDHLKTTSVMTDEQMNALKGMQREEFKVRMKQFVERQGLYEKALKQMYADMLQHLSLESMNLLTKDSEVYSSCDQKQDPLILWTLLQTCHSQVGRKVSDEELRLKKMKLENLKQWDEKGNVCSLEDHDRVWRELYEEATHIGVEWNEEELIRIYLRSVDSTHIMHDLSAILKPGATDFPASVVEASYWVASTVQRNKVISENQPPGRKRYKDPQLTANFTQNSNEASSTFPKCVFCEKFHDGGAQKCTRLKALMKAKPDVVEQFTRMESKKSKRRRDKDDGNPKSNRKRSKGSTRRGKANAQKWADREKTDNSQSPKTSAASIAEQESSEVKDLMTKVLKMSKLGELNFHFRVTPLNSYQNGDIKDMSSHYMLDSGSNCNVLGNRELAWNITTIAPTDIVGMGSVTVTEAAECIFGPCLIAPIPLNIIAESAVIK